MQTIAPDVTTCPLCNSELRECDHPHTDANDYPGRRKHCSKASMHNFLVREP